MKKKDKKIRPLGTILCQIEPLLLEAVDGHDLQWGDIYGLLRQYLEIHLPNHQEKYTDKTVPVFYYGHSKRLKKGKI